MADALPADWAEYKDDNGNTYFYNSVTGETAWERPGNAGN